MVVREHRTTILAFIHFTLLLETFVLRLTDLWSFSSTSNLGCHISFEMVWIKFHVRFTSACATVEMCSTMRVWTIVGGWSLLNCFFKFLLFFPFFAYESDSSVNSLFNSFSWACIIDLLAFYWMVL